MTRSGPAARKDDGRGTGVAPRIPISETPFRKPFQVSSRQNFRQFRDLTPTSGRHTTCRRSPTPPVSTSPPSSRAAPAFIPRWRSGSPTWNAPHSPQHRPHRDLSLSDMARQSGQHHTVDGSDQRIGVPGSQQSSARRRGFPDQPDHAGAHGVPQQDLAGLLNHSSDRNDGRSNGRFECADLRRTFHRPTAVVLFNRARFGNEGRFGPARILKRISARNS
jgi:hypothetical protein